MLTIGLDTHLRTSTLCILDGNGKQINTRTIRGHWTRTVAYIRELGERLRVVFEASCGYGPVHDALAALGHITKAGPATARKLLVEASWQVIRKDAAMRAFFDRVTGGKPDRRKIALVAVAHKLSRCMLAMLRSGETWRATPIEPDADATNDVNEHNG